MRKKVLEAYRVQHGVLKVEESECRKIQSFSAKNMKLEDSLKQHLTPINIMFQVPMQLKNQETEHNTVVVGAFTIVTIGKAPTRKSTYRGRYLTRENGLNSRWLK